MLFLELQKLGIFFPKLGAIAYQRSARGLGPRVCGNGNVLLEYRP